MVNKFLIALLLGIVLSGFNSCFVLNRYIYTDAELKTHYTHLPLKPIYRHAKYLEMDIHYALMSKNDTLPLLVLLHGAPGAWYGYMNLMDDTTLQNQYRMVSIDRPGYGKSNYGQAQLSTNLQAQAIAAVIEDCNFSNKPITLLGRSYGAPIAAKYALHYPQKIAQLIMVSPVIDPTKEKFYWFSPIGKWKVVQWLLPKVLNVATKEKYAHPAEMLKMESQWQHLYCPTTVLVGAKDWIADTSNYTFAKQHLVNAPTRFYKLVNTGHLITYEQPELIKQILINKINF